MEDLLIRKIKGGIIGIKTGTKKPQEIAVLLNRLLTINEGMYADLLAQYKEALKSIKE